MPNDELTMFCYTDLAAQVRGKGVPAARLDKRLRSGIAWTPTNLMFTALGTIADSPWGPHGDLTLMPDPATAVEVDFGDGTSAERFYLCDLLETDETPWDCCPRTFLKTAVIDLKRATGLELRATFEHEFVYAGANPRASDNYSLDAVRRHGRFGETFLGALKAAGIDVDTYLPEFAAGQFEVTVPPENALAACDTAVTLRELARATAFRLGHGLSFSPRVTPDGLGNGVHVHFSLWDADGHPVSYDPDALHGVGELAGQFLAGIARRMPALCAFTAPSPVSYLRLVSHAWTGVWSNVGYRDREAGLRICPTFGKDAARVAEQFNFEYRAADATANPYLLLGTIMRAGMEGLAERLPAPTPTVDADPESMSDEKRSGLGIVRLPSSVDAAFAALEADPVVRGFLPPRLFAAYRANKEAEFALSRDWSPNELCTRYAEIY